MKSKLSIVVVEDDEALNNLITRKLTREGHACAQLHGGVECLQWLKTNTADLMILDLGLPDKNGEELIDEITQAGIKIPFIVATGQGSESIAVKMLKKGARDYLIKNVELTNVLPSTVEMVWKEIELQRRLHEAEMQIRLQNATLSAVHNLSPQGIMVVDANDNILSHNASLAKLFSIDEASLAGKGAQTVRRFIAACGAPATFQAETDKCATAPDTEIHLKDLRVGGRFLELHSTPMRADGSIVGRIWYFYDVTTFKEAEDAMAKAKKEAESHAQMKDHFLNVLSHDVKTPLNSVMGFADLLSTTHLDATQKEYIDYINDSSSYLLTLVNDILDLSKIEHGAITLEVSKFILEDTLNRCVDSFKHHAQSKNVELIKDFAPDMPKILVGDELRLRQIIINLMANAVKFTFKGSVTLRCDSQGSDLVAISITDTGIGIKEDFQKVMFAPFSQETSTVSKKLGGTGLGLSIVRHLVHIFNGDISVESSLGKGTTFKIVFPKNLSKNKPQTGVTTIYS